MKNATPFCSLTGATILRKIPLLFCLALLPCLAKAQGQVIRGTVLGDNLEALIGVSISLKGTQAGTTSDYDGRFSISVPNGGGTLVFSYIGYLPQEIPVSGQAELNVVLQTDHKQLSEVVVTALGVEREKKALGFAVQDVDGSEMTEARETNLVNALSGKIAGATIVNAPSGGVGGSARITLRGESSLNINKNQPLFVVDGVPISNDIYGSSGRSHLEVDYGNAAAEINPDDIASISVLKGPSATALYGSRGANGVILIKTKTGKGRKGIGVSVNSGITFENPLRMPKWQDVYGQGNNGQFAFADGSGAGISDGVDESWGPRLDAGLNTPQFDSPRDIGGFRGGDLNAPEGSTILPTPWVSRPGNIDEFFRTGTTYSNNISITGANDAGDFRLSMTSLNQQGMVPNTNLDRYNFNLNAGYKLTDRLTARVNATYINTSSDNRPAISYGTESLMYLWIWYGRQVNTLNLRDYWMPGLEGVQQFNYNYNYHDNPWFTAYENTNAQRKDRLLGNITLNYRFSPYLQLMVRSGTDYYYDLRPRQRAFSTQRFPFGSYREESILFNELNTDFLLSYNRSLGGGLWDLEVSAGGNQMNQKQNYLDLMAPQLSIPGIYNFGNSRVQLESSAARYQKRINSLYGFARLGYRSMMYLEVTARNDWSSTLPLTNNSYFYPSVSLSGVLSEMMTMPSWMPFAKVRLSYAQVGNDTDPYNLINFYNYGTAWGSTQTVSESGAIFNADLKPELLNSFEAGVDARFFNGRLGVDLTFYDTRSKNQILPITISNVSGYNTRIINAGEIRNRGAEIILSATPIRRSNGFNWDVRLNWARNLSEVIELAEGVEAYTLAERNGAYVQARVGERMGAIYGQSLMRVEDKNSPYYGQVIHSTSGVPLTGTELKYQGNYNPEWIAGLQNAFSYKGFDFSFLFDIRYGGIVVSRTKTIGSTSGQLEETLFGRENPIDGYDLSLPGNGIIGEGVVQNADGSYRPNDIVITSRNWHNRYYNRSNVEVAKYDASFIKLREVRLGYTIPKRMLGNLPFQNVKIAVVGRNLLLFTENPHFDPESASMSGGTLQPGIEDMAYPTARSIGINLSFNL